LSVIVHHLYNNCYTHTSPVRLTGPGLATLPPNVISSRTVP